MASSSSSSPELCAAAQASSHEYAYASVQYSDLSRDEVLEDLSSRFILNLPEEELASVERVCFQVEQAHWYYEDFIREQNPSKFPSYTLKTFSEALFRACPLLTHWAEDHERTFESFMKYKTRVPVCGAIMLNDTWDKVVLVKGWKSSAGWGFPKGKINEQEPKYRCAIREVLEETGYNLEGQLDPDNVLQMSIKEQSISLYIVPGVPEDFPFETKTRKEISKISWFRLTDLPTWKRNKTAPGKFYLISPFIGPLKAFIHDRKPRNLPRKVHRPPVHNVKEELHSSSEEDGVATHDQNAQELSSQASSAEPHTPSPQYSAARVHDSTFESTIGTATPDPARQVPTATLGTGDSHLAGLLNGLVRSAASVALDNTTKARSTPGEIASARAASPCYATPSQPSVSPDWSARGPAKLSAPLEPPVALPSSLAISSRPQEQPPPQTGPTPAVPSATSPSLSAAGSAGHTRRGSTADISPYLAHSRNITKEMRYISILESVAQESDRATSRMGHRSPMPAHLHSAHPLPPPSVPPPKLDQSDFYSSPAPHIPLPMGHHAAYRMQAPDAFIVRPRTSHAYHPPLFAPAAVPRQSMNEHQLRALMPLNGPHGGSASSFVPPLHPVQLQTPTNPLRSVPPHYPAPHTARNNAIRPSNGAQLLSILNTPTRGFRA